MDEYVREKYLRLKYYDLVADSASKTAIELYTAPCLEHLERIDVSLYKTVNEPLRSVPPP